MDLPAIAHLTSAATMPVAIAACVYMAVRTAVVLVAVFGSKERAARALEVLRVLRRDREPK